MNISPSPPNLLSPTGASDSSSIVVVSTTAMPQTVQDFAPGSSDTSQHQQPLLVIGEHRNQTRSPSSNSHYDTIDNKTTVNNKKQLKTEYKSNFTPFDQYVYNEHTDSFVKTQHLQTPANDSNANKQQLNLSNQDLSITHQQPLANNGPSPVLNAGAFEPLANGSSHDHASSEPWYKEVVRRNEKANEYRYKSEIGHQSPLLSKEILSDEDLVRRSPCGNDPLIEAQIRDHHQQQHDPGSDSTSTATSTHRQAAIRFSPNDYKRDHLIAYMANNNNFNPPREQTNETSSSSHLQNRMAAPRGSGGTHAALVSSRPLARSGAQARARSQSSRRRPMTTITTSTASSGLRNSDAKSSTSQAASKSHQTTPTKRPTTARPGTVSSSTAGNRFSSHVSSNTKTNASVSTTSTTTTTRASSRPLTTSTSAAAKPTNGASAALAKSSQTRRPPSANIKPSPRTAALASSHRAISSAANSISNSVRLTGGRIDSTTRATVGPGTSGRLTTPSQRAPIAPRSPVKKASPSLTSATVTSTNRTGSTSGPVNRTSASMRSANVNKQSTTSPPATGGSSNTQIKSIKTPKALADAKEKAAAAAAALAVGTVATAGGAAAAAVTSKSVDPEQISALKPETSSSETNEPNIVDLGNSVTPNKTDIDEENKISEAIVGNFDLHQQPFTMIQEPNFIFNNTTETGNMLADELAQAEQAAAMEAAKADLQSDVIDSAKILLNQDNYELFGDNLQQKTMTQDDKMPMDDLLVAEPKPDDEIERASKPLHESADEISSNELINGLKDGLISAEDRFDSSDRDVVSLENNNNTNSNNNYDENLVQPAIAAAAAPDTTYTIQQGQNFDEEPYSIIASNYDNDAQPLDDSSSDESDKKSIEMQRKTEEHMVSESVTEVHEENLATNQPQNLDDAKEQQQLVDSSNDEEKTEINDASQVQLAKDNSYDNQFQENQGKEPADINDQDGDKVLSDRFSSSSSSSINSMKKFGANDDIVDRRQESDLHELHDVDITKSSDLVGDLVNENDNKHIASDHENASTNIHSSSSSDVGEIEDNKETTTSLDITEREVSKNLGLSEQGSNDEPHQEADHVAEVTAKEESSSDEAVALETDKLMLQKTVTESPGDQDTNDAKEPPETTLHDTSTVDSTNDDMHDDLSINSDHKHSSNAIEKELKEDEKEEELASERSTNLHATHHQTEADKHVMNTVQTDNLLLASDNEENLSASCENKALVDIQAQDDVVESQDKNLADGRSPIVASDHQSFSSSSSSSSDIVEPSVSGDNKDVEEADGRTELLMNVADLAGVEAKKKQDMARRSELARQQSSSSSQVASNYPGEVLLSVDQLSEQMNKFTNESSGDNFGGDLDQQESERDLTLLDQQQADDKRSQAKFASNDSGSATASVDKKFQEEAPGLMNDDNEPGLVGTSTLVTNSSETLKSSSETIHSTDLQQVREQLEQEKLHNNDLNQARHEELSSCSSSQDNLMNRVASEARPSQASENLAGVQSTEQIQHIAETGPTVAEDTNQTTSQEMAMRKSVDSVNLWNNDPAQDKDENMKSQQSATNDDLMGDLQQIPDDVDGIQPRQRLNSKGRDHLSNYDEDHDDQDDELDSDEQLKLSNHLTNSDDELILEPRNSIGSHRLTSMSSSRYNEGAGLGMIAHEDGLETDMAELGDGFSAEIIERTNAENRIEVSTSKSTILPELSPGVSFIHQKLAQEDDSDEEILDLNHDADPTDLAATMSPNSSVASELLRMNPQIAASAASAAETQEVEPKTVPALVPISAASDTKEQNSSPKATSTTMTAEDLTTDRDSAKPASDVAELNVDSLIASSDAALRAVEKQADHGK